MIRVDVRIGKTGRGRNCGHVVFVTEVERTDAPRFYESHGYKPDAYKGFEKRLRKPGQ